MKRIILDTDLGADSDDAVALALVLAAEREKLCEILAVTVSTTRDGACEVVNAFSDFYNGKRYPAGKMVRPLDCDKRDFYVDKIRKLYAADADRKNAVDVMRRALADSEGKVTVVAIGPLRNISDLLESEPDEYSPLSGRELFAEKAEKLYIMGGSFKDNVPGGAKYIGCEWNIVQDIRSAKKVVELCPADIVFSPFEVGFEIISVYSKRDTPLWHCMKSFAEETGAECDKEVSRYSWDPVTVMAAMETNEWQFVYSDVGNVVITDEGETLFVPCEKGKCRYISSESNLRDIERKLNDFIKG